MSEGAWEDRMERVAMYIEENLEDIDSAREVAEVVDVSYEALRKRFRRRKSMPLGKYLRLKRVDEARRLLVETDDPVYVVCWKVGFASDSSGIRTFKRYTGMTMGEYRRRYRNQGK